MRAFCFCVCLVLVGCGNARAISVAGFGDTLNQIKAAMPISPLSSGVTESILWMKYDGYRLKLSCYQLKLGKDPLCLYGGFEVPGKVSEIPQEYSTLLPDDARLVKRLEKADIGTYDIGLAYHSDALRDELLQYHDIKNPGDINVLIGYLSDSRSTYFGINAY